MKFDVILADPLWPYHFPNTRNEKTPDDYKTMSIQEICDLPISEISAENCALFLWVIWPQIWESKAVIESWGFTYRTEAWQWVKAKPNGFGFHFGMGQYTRANTEPCLLAIKGNMPPARHDIQALIYAPVRQHSRKPDEQYQKIEKLYPGMAYVELFARRKRPGWFSWGNEIESSTELSGLTKHALGRRESHRQTDVTHPEAPTVSGDLPSEARRL